MSLNIISANHLRTGLNVYFIQNEAGNRWDTDYTKASIYDPEKISEAFDQAQQDMDNNIVVDCVIVPVDKNHVPLTTRERIRSTGPSSKYGHAVSQ